MRVVIVAGLVAAALIAGGGRERAGRALYEAGFPRLAAGLLGGPAWAGVAHYRSGAYLEAVEAFRAADFPGQLYDVGTALARAGQLRDSIAAFDDALERDPNDEDARFNQALVESLLATRRGMGPDAHGAANARATTFKRGNDASPDAGDDVGSIGDGASGDRDSGQAARDAAGSKAMSSGRADQQGGTSGAASGSIGAGAGPSRSGDAYANVAQPPVQLAHRLEVMQHKTVAASTRWLETMPDDPGAYVRRRIAHERDARKARGLAAPEATDRW